MTLKDLLKKKEKFKENEAPAPPQFTFVRTDTLTQEIISPPSFNESPPPPSGSDPHHHAGGRRLPHFRTASATTISSRTSTLQGERRLSRPLRLRSASSRASSVGSANVPFDLPSIAPGSDGSDDKEAQWEERATLLARGNPHGLPGGANADLPPTTALRELSLEEDGNGTRPKMARSVSDAQGDESIQEAIRLHEAGDLARSTAMFGRLSDPQGANNALSQVLYGLALRHGWGIPPDASLAITYLSYAASNSASIESEALAAGMKKGGAAKGELVLAIYELGNCFRHGWGVNKDPLAARSYYETAANLGDVDSMNEVAWCYEHGFGGKKDKFIAARYYRLAEEKGSKTLGNSWIWKAKYNPKEST